MARANIRLLRSDPAEGIPDEALSPNLSADLQAILYHASLAPSGHNAQPWTVHVLEPEHLLIGTARARWLPAVDPHNREVLLSIGAFLENLISAAGCVGYDVDYRVIGSSPTARELVEVKLRKASPREFALEKIRLRRIVRGGHLPGEVRGDDLRILSEPLGKNLLFISRASGAGRYLEEGTLEANRIQTYRDPAQEELSRWIRWSDEDARQFRNGLTAEALNITGFAGWYVRRFMNPHSVMKSGFRARSVDVVRGQLRSYGGWLVITSGDSGIPTLLETGRRFQRMLLGIRERMIAIHPMSQMLEEAPFQTHVAKELGVSGSVQFILRVSYMNRYPDPVSPRMPASWFVTN